MNFLDPAFFLAFLPIALLAFYASGRWLGREGAALVFAALSIVFCVPFGWRFVLLALASAALNWFLCDRLVRGEASAGQRRWMLRLGVVANLGALALFKYVPALDLAAGIAPALRLWVPITISFYTFQRLVLLVDCHNREPAAVRLCGGAGGGARFLAFTMAFPNLVIGPIALATEMAGQIGSRRFGRLRMVDLQVGITLLAIGLFKKLVIADTLGSEIVDPVFGRIATGQPGYGVDAVFGILGYYAQLYFDFSGYSDIALGVSRLFGLRLPYNFNSPLRATGIVDFYRRWHITLTRVVSRFLFQALALKGARFARKRKWKGTRRKLCELWLPLIANFLVIGVWHDAAWNFVVFGAIHGLWYIVETEVRASRGFAARAAQLAPWLQRSIGQAITVVPLALTFSLFRSPTLGHYADLLGAATNPHGFFAGPATHVINATNLPHLVLAFAVIWLLPNAIELLGRYRPGITTFVVPSHTPGALAFRWQPTLVWGLFVALLMAGVIKACGVPAPFVYGGF